jgi:non-specific serine/threonine protein kinase
MDQWTIRDVVVDFGTRQVYRSGQPVAISPKAFQLLGVLIESRPRALSRQELQDRLWPETYVVEKNLTNLVGEIRAALGDDPARPHIIRTVARFGYACLDEASAAGTAPGERVEPSGGRGTDGTGLPEPLTRFIGRAREVADLAASLSATRLLTLTGAGGSGKTRLALALAKRAADQFPDGLWLVDLSPVQDPEALAQTVAAVLGVRQPSGSLATAIAASLSRRRALLLLDNCEHLVACCADLASHLLAAAPRLTIVATSREPLGIGGERIWQVRPLSAPEAGEVSPEVLETYEAVQLLIDRAQRVDPTFAITPATAPAVSEVCRRLDGLPLAIELAAGRLTVLSIDQIRDRLDDRFRLLSGGDRISAARQKTLEAAVAWSYELLEEPERVLLRRLAVFARDWTLESAEEVAVGRFLEREDVLDVLARLVDKSLVLVSPTLDGGRRYRFLETIRHYARARLAESGEAGDVADRHLLWCLRLVEPDAPGPAGWDGAWLERLHDEHDTFRAALAWCASTPERTTQGLALAVGLVPYWTIRGHFAEGRRWLTRILDSGVDLEGALAARALAGLGQFAFFQGDLASAGTWLARGAADAQRAGDMATAAMAFGFHALTCLEAGDLAQGEALAREGLTAARATGIDQLEGPALSFMAYRTLARGDLDETSHLMEQLVRRAQEASSTWGLAITQVDLALLRLIQARPDEGRSLGLEAMTHFEAVGDRWGIGCALGMVAGAEAVSGRYRRAARLRGAMEGVLERVGASVQESYTRLVGTPVFAEVERRLGARRYAQALDEGRGLPLHDALAEARRPVAPGTRRRGG